MAVRKAFKNAINDFSKLSREEAISVAQTLKEEFSRHDMKSDKDMYSKTPSLDRYRGIDRSSITSNISPRTTGVHIATTLSNLIPQPKVFLSHCHKDKVFCRKLKLTLESHGIKVWFDEAEILVGESLIDKIRNGIDTVDFLVAVISKNSINSGWVQKEVDIAMNQEIKGKQIKVLPLIIDDSEAPGFLLGKLYIDISKPWKRTKAISSLIDHIIQHKINSGMKPTP